MSKRFCNECGNTIPPDEQDCIYCHHNKEIKYDHRCEYASDGRRCPAMGTNSDNLRKGGPWYCRWHYYAKSAKERAQILDDLITNGVPVEKDWRDELIQAKQLGKQNG